LKGYLFDWIIHPTSIFGLYPFSGYPIGSNLLFSFFFLISGNSVTRATLMLSLFILGLMVFSTTLFLKEITTNRGIILISNIFYIFTPILYEFAYFAPNARLMTFVLAPLFFCFLLRWKKTRKRKDLTLASTSVIVMFLFHRISMAFAVLLVAAIVFILVYERWKKFLFKMPKVALTLLKHVIIFQIIGFFVLFLLSGLIFDSIFKHELSAISFFESLDPTLREIINYSFDYYQFWGPAIFCAVLGILIFVFQCLKLNPSSTEYLETKEFFPLLLMLFCIFVMSPFFRIEAYTRHILIPIILPFSVYPMKYLLRREKLFQVFITFMYLVFLTFYNLYNLIWKEIGIYFYIAWIIFLVFLIFLAIDLFFRIVIVSKRLFYFLLKVTSKRTPSVRALSIEQYLSEKSHLIFSAQRYIQTSTLLILIAVNSVILYEIKYTVVDENPFPPPYMSNEEVEIANYIKSTSVFSSEPYITVCSTHYLLETRIGAYAGMLFLSDSSQVSLMISDYIDRWDVLQNSTLKSPTKWLESSIFYYNSGFYYSYNEKEELSTKTFWRVVMRNPYNSSDAQILLDALNIHFFVKLKESDIAYFRLGDEFLSPFAQTIPEEFMVYETNQMYLYQIPSSR
jgi:hypothetical protein